jgi:hypothetical protein
MFCTIKTAGYGSPHRHYLTKQAALKAAQRHCRQHGEAMEVAWCKTGDPSNPKLWLAYVTTDGTRFTDSWSIG